MVQGVVTPSYGVGMGGQVGTSIQYGGVRIDLSHVREASRLPMLAEAQAWIDAGRRPPILTVRSGGVDVSTRPDLWPATVRDYRGPGRIEWVGDD